jgi:2-keto-4-pentenoate hydratase/2-oxohepta-3-ene-1,7-dioic acid hydratase in catechol pathway
VEAGAIRPVDVGFAARYPDLKSALAAGALGEAATSAGGAVDLAGIRFAPPIPNPGKIVAIGMNYRAHTAELNREQPDAPSLFVRFPDSVVGHGDPIVRPAVSEQFDFEGELAVVIGRTARHVAAADAYDYVAGYSCLLDGSLRDWQYRTSQFTAGKNFYRSGAFGPWLVTADAIDDPQALNLRTRVSGELMQDGNTSQMVFSIAELIEFLTKIFPLEPGDVIATGTPSGIGAARKPPRWLVPGDVVEVEIEGIGTLRNEVVAES